MHMCTYISASVSVPMVVYVFMYVYACNHMYVQIHAYVQEFACVSKLLARCNIMRKNPFWELVPGDQVTATAAASQLLWVFG